MAKSIKILILGGGFAGIKTALELSGNNSFSLTLISDQSDFRYYPTLYRAATGGNPAASTIPLAEIFKSTEVTIEQDYINSLNRAERTVSGNHTYSYDILIVALGVVTNYFGIKGLKEYSYGIKSQEQAQELRNHIHRSLMEEGKPDLNYIVIGGGPTGVELAGELPGYIRHVMKMHRLRPKKLHIDLIEAAERLMPRMRPAYSAAIKARLMRLGIKLYLGEAVQAESAAALTVGGKPIQSRTVIWTAGVTNHPFFNRNDFILNDHGKVSVDQFMQAEENIYVIGDNADTPYSGMAQTALYDAKFVAANIIRQSRGRHQHSYKPKNPVYVTPVGPGWAAVVWGKVHLYGRLGWLLRAAADFAGYKDYEPWWPAARHWAAEFEPAGNCLVCSGKEPAD